MRPGARVAAAIEILDQVAEDGLACEQALTRWARGSRFAGSKDRAAIRDYVFDVQRLRRTAAHFGQGEDGRALMIGLLHMQEADFDALFSGEGHAPEPLSDAERAFPDASEDDGVLWNLPDWILPQFNSSLQGEAQVVAHALQDRAPVTLRVNTARVSVKDISEDLVIAGITTRANPLAETALTVTEGARKIRNTPAYQDGLIELQDAASQAITASLPTGGRVLDLCAGGGGKALALAHGREVFAHDIDPKRMRDLPLRAARAQADIELLETDKLAQFAPFEIVLCDAPCSGSGAWRRSAEGKWRLTPEQLQNLQDIQDSVLDQAATFVSAGGVLAYATCSVFTCENEDRIAAFLARAPDWECTHQSRFAVDENGDGFFSTHLIRK